MLRRILPFILPMISIPAMTVAQHSGIGIKGGLLMSDTRSLSITTNTIPGATAGIYFPLRAGDRLEIQPELLITTLGAGYTLSDGERSTVRTLYLQVPLCAKLYVGNTFNAQGGFLMGRLLLAQQDSPNGNADVTASYNTWDFGIVLGLGADLITGLDIGLRYYNGMRTVLVDDDIYFPRNRAYMLTLGYRIGRLKAPSFKRNRG